MSFSRLNALMFLCCVQDKACVNPLTLQHTFVQYLMKKLLHPETRPEKVEDWVEGIYGVLSVMPWSNCSRGGQLEGLCEALWAAREGPLTEERILSSLLRPGCDSIVSAYCTTALRLQRGHILRSAPDIQGCQSVFSSS